MAKKEIINNDAVTVRVGEAAGETIETVLDNAEKALDVIEDKLDVIEDGIERVVTVTKNNPFLIAGALIVGLGIGGFIGWKIAEKRLSLKFEEELDEQVEAAKLHYRRQVKEGEFESPEAALQALHPDDDEIQGVVRSYQGRSERVPYNDPEKIIEPPPAVTVVTEKVEVTQNVFTDQPADDPRDWDYRLEIADREANPDQPYVISFEEFNANEVGHEQTNLSYYTEDDTLADSQDKPVDSVDYTIGNDNLDRFGHGSGDVNVVYVRNEKIDMDFEIVKIIGSYQKEVLGTDPEPSLQHSRRSGRQRWRTDE